MSECILCTYCHRWMRFEGGSTETRRYIQRRRAPHANRCVECPVSRLCPNRRCGECAQYVARPDDYGLTCHRVACDFDVNHRSLCGLFSKWFSRDDAIAEIASWMCRLDVFERGMEVSTFPVSWWNFRQAPFATLDASGDLTMEAERLVVLLEAERSPRSSRSKWKGPGCLLAAGDAGAIVKRVGERFHFGRTSARGIEAQRLVSARRAARAQAQSAEAET